MSRKDLNIAIGNRIRLIREAQGKTRDKLSEEADISAHFLFEIETGKKSMTSNTIINLARALNVTTDFLLMGEVTPLAKIVNNLEGLPPDQLNCRRETAQSRSEEKIILSAPVGQISAIVSQSSARFSSTQILPPLKKIPPHSDSLTQAPHRTHFSSSKIIRIKKRPEILSGLKFYL